MTLPLEQARLRAAVLRATGEAARHSEQALRLALRGRLSDAETHCFRAIEQLDTAQASLEQWRRIR